MPGNHSTIYIYSIVNRTLWDEEEKLSFGHGQLQNSSYQRTFYCLIQWQYQKIKFSARQYSKISKKLPNFFHSDFWATPWSKNLQFNQSERLGRVVGNPQKSIFFLFVLKACLHLYERTPTSKQRQNLFLSLFTRWSALV